MQPWQRIRALVALLAWLVLPGVSYAQLSSVTVTIDSITNKGCFDRIIVFCTKPELTVRVGLRQRDGTIVRCPDSAPATNLINVTGPIASCAGKRVEAPFDLIVSIADADESKLPAIEIQETGRLSNASSGDALVPWFNLGSGVVNIQGPDADVSMRVSIQPVLPAFQSAGLSVSPRSIDPSVGDQVVVSTQIVERGTSRSYASGARVGLVAVSRSSGATVDLGEGVFQQRLNVTWNGRNGNTPMPAGTYVIRATMSSTGETVSSPEFTIAASTPALEITRLADWNSRAGPVDVGYRLTRPGSITARLFGPTALGGAANPCDTSSLPQASASHSWQSNAGNFAHGVPLVTGSGSFLGDGNYCMRLESGGHRAERKLAVRNGPALFLGVSPRPAIPALSPGAPVFIEARALDDRRQLRPTGSITVKASLTDVGLPMPSVSTTCQAVSRCQLAIPASMANPSVIALLAFEASATDLPNPAGSDPQPASATVGARGTSVGPTLGRGYGAISIPLEPDAASGFRTFGRPRVLDVAIHPGTGFDLADAASRTQFVDTVDTTMRLVFGEDSSVKSTTVTSAPDAFSFWFTTTRADIGVYADKGDALCRRDAMTPLPFAEVQGVFHLVDCRDTADGSGSTFSALATPTSAAARTFWHELHHGAFDLADEYADDGGYFQTIDLPNVFGSAAACQQFGAEPALCEQIGAREEDACTAKGTPVKDCPIRRVDWWRSGPRVDVMIGNTVENADDRRRANFVIDRCRRGLC